MSFEETYKSSYSHGLEAIYALETVNVRSIRRLQAPPAQPPPLRAPCVLPMAPQLEFDFGASFRAWLEPFLLDEPIQVLGLSRHAEKCLLEQRKERLRDLIGCNLRQLIFVKGKDVRK
jgi:hypothetical protein